KLRNDFTDPTVEFSRYELLKLLGWPDQKQYYQRLKESLRCWVGVTLHYDGCWWDNRRKRRVSASFHILEEVVLPDEDDPKAVSSFTWGKKFFKSCRDGNLKRLDLPTYFALKSAISKQLYRFLDKRFYLRPDWTFDLPELAHEHVGLSRNYAPWKIKQKLQPALDELEEIGFLEPISAGDRYTKTGRGAWNIRLVRKLPAPAEAKPGETKPAEPEPTGLEKELVERGVTRSAAIDLVRDFPADRLRRQIEVVDWLRETKPKRVHDLGAYLAKAIREDYAAPAGFEGRAARAARETARREAIDRETEAREAKAREREERDRVRAYWEALPPARRAALEAEALDQADPADRTADETASSPARRLLLVGLHDALIRQRSAIRSGFNGLIGWIAQRSSNRRKSLFLPTAVRFSLGWRFISWREMSLGDSSHIRSGQTSGNSKDRPGSRAPVSRD
ncbi:MAG: replication initiator protein A, partial [Planctomycetaceae bacterium]|nr:replication initiator protein A [Planctomycetaceae bacterium]